jgi:hypothetical protein
MPEACFLATTTLVECGLLGSDPTSYRCDEKADRSSYAGTLAVDRDSSLAVGCAGRCSVS